MIFLVPFAFILSIASKDRVESNLLEFSWPSNFVLFDNLVQAFSARDYLMVIAFINSVILTVASVAALVVLSAMVAYVWQRRSGRASGVINGLVLAGLIVPPAIVPTIWVLQGVGLFKTMAGLILVEIAYGLPVLRPALPGLHQRSAARARRGRVDRRGEPAPDLLPGHLPGAALVIVTVVILQSVFIYNDFQNPLYFLPGTENATIQLTLLNFQSQFNTQYNLLFSTIFLVMIPPLAMFVVFNRRIVEGMAAGSVKG